MSLKKVIITGGSGYFGSLLAKKLLNDGYSVTLLDINKPDKELKKNTNFVECDIRNYEKLKKALRGYEIVYHNVAQVPLAKSKRLFNEVNIKGTENLCKASLLNDINKIVYTSSSAVYGIPKNNPVNEETIPSPLESYGKAKLMGEKICKEFSEKGLQVSIIRPRTILGHGRLGIFSILFSWISEGVNIPVLNNGKNIYQFVHAEDLADACISSSKIDKKFSSFNIGSKDCGSMRNTLENLCEYAKTGSKVYSLPLKPIELAMNFTSFLRLSPLSPYHSLMYGRSLYFDISKSEKTLGFKPKYSTSEMFIDSYNWFLSNKKIIYSDRDGSHHTKPVKELSLKILKWLS